MGAVAGRPGSSVGPRWAWFGQNKGRDERNRVALEALGYRVLVLWECELTPKLLPAAAERVRRGLED